MSPLRKMSNNSTSKKNEQLPINSQRRLFQFESPAKEEDCSHHHQIELRRLSTKSEFTEATCVTDDLHLSETCYDNTRASSCLEDVELNKNPSRLLQQTKDGLLREDVQRTWFSCSYLNRCLFGIALLIVAAIMLGLAARNVTIYRNKVAGLHTHFHFDQALFGTFLASSQDGTVIAVARTIDGTASGNSSNNNDYNLREIQVYRFQGDSTFSEPWQPIGQPLRFHEASISPVQLSGNGETIALVTSSLVTSGGSDTLRSYVYVLKYDEDKNTWIDPVATWDNPIRSSFEGYAVAMSADGRTLVVLESSRPWSGALHKAHQQYIKIYTFDGSSWKLLLESGNLPDRPTAMKLSSDGSTLALLGHNDKNLSGNCTLRVYKQEESLGSSNSRGDHMKFVATSETASPSWVQWGKEMEIQTSDPFIGRHQFEFSLSSNGDVLAVASGGKVDVFFSFGGVEIAGSSSVLDLEEWNSMGQPLLAEGTKALQDDESPSQPDISNHLITSVAMSQDGRTLAVGSTSFTSESPSLVQYYHYHADNNYWVSIGESLQKINEPTFGQELYLSSYTSPSRYESMLVIGSGNGQVSADAEVEIYRVVVSG